MKKILFCITTLNGGGAERALCNITMAMPEDVQIDILANCEEPEKDYKHRGNVISIASVSNRKIRIPFPLKVAIGRILKLRKLKRCGNYDACISFMEDSNIANILTGNKYCKVILSERTTLSKAVCSKYKKFEAKILYKKVDKVVAVSKGVEEDLNKNFDVPLNKIMTIYNGYDIESIRQLAGKEPGYIFDKDCFYFLNTGRVGSEKAQWHLIRAYANVEKRHPECRLIICGEGPYMEMLQKMVRDYGLEDKISFLGFVKNPYAISNKCDAFVFPSMYEGLPNALIENMICGLPIIATDFKSGAREILASDTDYKFQVKDRIELAQYGIITPVCSGKKCRHDEPLEKEERLLAEAMIKMVEDRGLKEHYGRQALKRAQDFAIEKQVEQWLGLLN